MQFHCASMRERKYIFQDKFVLIINDTETFFILSICSAVWMGGSVWLFFFGGAKQNVRSGGNITYKPNYFAHRLKAK